MLEEFKKIYRYDLFFILVGIGFMISLIICSVNFSHDFSERECVKFYKKYHYVTNDCKRYANKLEALDLIEK